MENRFTLQPFISTVFNQTLYESAGARAPLPLALPRHSFEHIIYDINFGMALPRGSRQLSISNISSTAPLPPPPPPTRPPSDRWPRTHFVCSSIWIWQQAPFHCEPHEIRIRCFLAMPINIYLICDYIQLPSCSRPSTVHPCASWFHRRWVVYYFYGFVLHFVH